MLNRKHDIFICYRRYGGDFIAHKIKRDLRRKGYRVFIDDDIDRDRYMPVLLNKIHNCKDFILIISPGCFYKPPSEEPDWVEWEVDKVLEYNRNHSRESRKRIIPITMYSQRINKIRIPKSISEVKGYVTIEGMSVRDYNYRLNEIVERLTSHRINKHIFLTIISILFIISMICFNNYFRHKNVSEVDNSNSIIEDSFSINEDTYDSSDEDLSMKSENSENDTVISDSILDISTLEDNTSSNDSAIPVGTDAYDFNSTTNVVNGGIANYDNESGVYYYGNIDLRSSDLAGDNVKTLYDSPAYCINIIGDELYFIAPNEGDVICKINKDGSGFEKVYENYCHELTYYKEWLYFCSDLGGSDYYICRMKPDGTEFTTLIQSREWYMNIYDDVIYFINYDRNHSICSMNLDGSNYQELLSDNYYYDLCVANDKIYFSESEEQRNLYSMNLDATGKDLLHDSYTRNTNYFNGKLYYVNTNRELCRCDMNGNNIEIIADSYSYEYISILPNLICCCDANDYDNVYIIENDIDLL